MAKKDNRFDVSLIRERLQRYLEHEGLNNSRFEKKCGLYNGFVKDLDSQIKFESLAKIGECCPNLNLGWLFSGAGSMIICEQSSSDAIPSVNMVGNAQAVFIANWTDLEPVVEKVVSKVIGGK